MNANPIAPVNAQTAARFDAKFIEDHKLIDRYLEGKLPVKGARDLENWCRANPAYLEALNLSERAQATLKLLEACGGPLDLTEPKPPWWKSPYVPIGAGSPRSFACSGSRFCSANTRCCGGTRGHTHPHASGLAGSTRRGDHHARGA